jgi:hypothetical protein
MRDFGPRARTPSPGECTGRAKAFIHAPGKGPGREQGPGCGQGEALAGARHYAANILRCGPPAVAVKLDIHELCMDLIA